MVREKEDRINFLLCKVSQKKKQAAGGGENHCFPDSVKMNWYGDRFEGSTTLL